MSSPASKTPTARLLRAHREQGDQRARERVVQLYLPLVDTFARRYEQPGAAYDELMRAGAAGLEEAIDAYVPRRDHEFLSFAAPIVAREIRRRLPDSPRELPPEFDFDDERLQLTGAFAAMDPLERRIVQLRLVDELGEDEVAQRLDLAGAELAQRTDVALAKLRTALERPGVVQAPAAEPQSPRTGERHSGRLLLRMPAALHSELAEAAEREQVSLNQYITNALAAAAGWQGAGDGSQRRAAPRWLRVAILVNLVLLAIAVVLAAILLIEAWRS